ncbi:hypothetical protein Air01nite_47280 [Asanoa iriomotensis]|uniref:Uncharacterized protein n=1 Tax=Asanoa iriomotensis TaxID=234613 RepID=A0ABQ4C767_9ACTN|nr:hypothetical protein Air01nite_47280 [Asanoa iriomotensis]
MASEMLGPGTAAAAGLAKVVAVMATVIAAVSRIGMVREIRMARMVAIHFGANKTSMDFFETYAESDL